MFLKRLCDELRKKDAMQTIDASDLGKKADYGTKIVGIEKKIPDHDKYITTPKVNKLTKYFAERFKIQFFCKKGRFS